MSGEGGNFVTDSRLAPIQRSSVLGSRSDTLEEWEGVWSAGRLAPRSGKKACSVGWREADSPRSLSASADYVNALGVQAEASESVV